MTMRVIDFAPNEALVAAIADRLETASSTESADKEPSLLDLDPEFLDTAKEMLTALTSRSREAPSHRQGDSEGALAVLDLDPRFLDAAKTMLRGFIEKTERNRRSKD